MDAARQAMWTFVIVNAMIVETLFLSAGSGKNGVLTLAKSFGLHAALLMMFQQLPVARMPWLDRRTGMDRLTGTAGSASPYRPPCWACGPQPPSS
ncbi:hypothetical protein ACFW93_20910 [Streptomyces canus]|uniref:hypothetical protein n=1 Tax=Streptomyces canus TaxID=58343 RepID=UPI00368D0763